MREEYDCQDFLDFYRTYGETVANNILQEACEAFYASKDRGRDGRVVRQSSESHDREGNNHTFKGTIDHGARCWYFEIEDGNNNGTVVHTWEREWKHGAYPVQAQSVWLLAPLRVIFVRYFIDRLGPVMLDGFNKLMETSMKSRILGRGDPVEIKFPTQDGAIWRPATVVACTAEKISVAYSDGARQDIQNVYFERYRIPEKSANG